MQAIIEAEEQGAAVKDLWDRWFGFHYFLKILCLHNSCILKASVTPSYLTGFLKNWVQKALQISSTIVLQMQILSWSLYLYGLDRVVVP